MDKPRRRVRKPRTEEPALPVVRRRVRKPRADNPRGFTLPDGCKPQKSPYADRGPMDWASVAGTPDDVVESGKYSPWGFMAVSPGSGVGRIGFLAHDAANGRRAMYLYTRSGSLKFRGWAPSDFREAFQKIIRTYKGARK